MLVTLRDKAFDPWDEIRRHQQQTSALRRGEFGASAVFIGTMRDFNEGMAVRAMTLEHYPEMTRKTIEEIGRAAMERHGLCEALVVHRVGEVLPGEAIVLSAVWSAHRNEAFAACREIMEALKSTAPFWKKEHGADDNDRWVEHNTPADTA